MRTKAIAGIIVTLFLTTMILAAVPVKSQPIDALKIGVIGPVGLSYWSPAGMKEAAEMARDEINAMGGIAFPEGNITITLYFGNEYAFPVPDPDAAKAEIRRMIAVEGCDIIIGGFRTETTTAMIEEAMDHQVPFIINGDPSTWLITQTVAVNYARYKYLFRTNPTNSDNRLKTIFGYLQLMAACKLWNIFGNPAYHTATMPKQIPCAVLVERLPWTTEAYLLLTDPNIYPQYLGPYFNTTYWAQIPETTTDLTPWLNNVVASGARILIHVFSGQVGLRLINRWKEMGIKAIPIGINLFAQMQEQDPWTKKLGKLEYETILNFGGTRTPITPQAVVFWDSFVGKTGICPTYTAWGAYDTIYGLRSFVQNTGITWMNFRDPDQFVAGYENAPVYDGLSGKFKFTQEHDVYVEAFSYLPYYSSQYVRERFVQWQKDPTSPCTGRMEVVSPTVETYTQKWKIPPWIYPSGYESLAETDTVALSNPLYNWTIDSTVDIGDIQWIAAAWLTKPVDPKWNCNADLNDDDFINIVDAVKIAKDFGKTVPGGYPI